MYVVNCFHNGETNALALFYNKDKAVTYKNNYLRLEYGRDYHTLFDRINYIEYDVDDFEYNDDCIIEAIKMNGEMMRLYITGTYFNSADHNQGVRNL